jgi:hypothetical protein
MEEEFRIFVSAIRRIISPAGKSICLLILLGRLSRASVRLTTFAEKHPGQQMK